MINVYKINHFHCRDVITNEVYSMQFVGALQFVGRFAIDKKLVASLVTGHN